MLKTRKTIKAKEFRKRVAAKLKSINNQIQEENLYFSCMSGEFYLEYRPKYPEKSNRDFLIHQDLNGSITVDGNDEKGGITLAFYENIEEFEEKFCVL